jgi:anti-sigma-K factor RskA
MIDDRHEELASLYACDLLAGQEREQFETELARNPELQRLVRELREGLVPLAVAASVAPPVELRGRVLAALDGGRAPAAPQRAPNRKLIFMRTAFPWAIAASFAIIGFWFAQKSSTATSELALVRAEADLARVGLENARSLFESERIVTQRQVSDLTLQLTARQRNLAQALQLTTEMTQKLTEAIEESRRQDAQVAELTQRLTVVDNELVALGRRMQTDIELANLKVTTLASMLNNSPEALAVAVWNPSRQEGVFTVEKLPALAPDQSYELWVIEAKEGARPVSAGVFLTGSDGGGRVQFKPVVAVDALAKFAVSRERRDGARAHAQPAEVVMMSK